MAASPHEFNLLVLISRVTPRSRDASRPTLPPDQTHSAVPFEHGRFGEAAGGDSVGGCSRGGSHRIERYLATSSCHGRAGNDPPRRTHAGGKPEPRATTSPFRSQNSHPHNPLCFHVPPLPSPGPPASLVLLLKAERRPCGSSHTDPNMISPNEPNFLPNQQKLKPFHIQKTNPGHSSAAPPRSHPLPIPTNWSGKV
jgi:hypothetical protein